jgi:hypothetical protein
MGITKYTNIEQIDSRTEFEGQLLKPEDLFIVTKQGETEQTDFGTCIYDAMEVSVYDINNNLLPQASGKNVAYIKGSDIKNYIYAISNVANLNTNELAINVEKLLGDIGIGNGILKVNINFVRNKIGSDNSLDRLWVQEISPTRQEIRIVPLKSANEDLNAELKKHMDDLQNQNVEFSNYRNYILTTLDASSATIQKTIKDLLTHKYGSDIFAVLKKDFGISNFDTYSQKIFDDFKQSMLYYMTNKNYIISDSNYGRPSAKIRFEDCEMYNPSLVTDQFKNMLYNSINYNTTIFIKKRVFQINSLPKTFDVVEIQNTVQNTLDTINAKTVTVNKVFDPTKVDIKFDSTNQKNVPVVLVPVPSQISITPKGIGVVPEPIFITPIPKTPIKTSTGGTPGIVTSTGNGGISRPKFT